MTAGSGDAAAVPGKTVVARLLGPLSERELAGLRIKLANLTERLEYLEERHAQEAAGREARHG